MFSNDDRIASEGVVFMCPFCGKKAAAFSQDGVVVHELPTCTKYDALDPLEFIVAVNRELRKVH